MCELAAMKARMVRYAALCLLGWLLSSTAAAAPMNFAVNNLSGQSSDDVWVLFFTGGTPVDGSYIDSTSGATVALQPTSIGSGNTHAIKLRDVQVDTSTGQPTFSINGFNGQMWFSYGSSAVDFTNGAPSPNSTSSDNIANFNKRFQYIEPTVVSSGGGAGVNVDQTLIDFFSIPISIQANSGPNTKATSLPSSAGNNQFTSSTEAFVNRLSQAATTADNNIYLNTTPENGPITVGAPNSNLSNFARAISPVQDPSLYHDWTNYLAALAPQTTENPDGGSFDAAGTQVHIADDYVGSGAGSGLPFQQQYYDLMATFSVDTTASTPTGVVTITGNTFESNGGDLLIANLTLTSTLADLNDATGVYGNAAAFDWTSTTPIKPVNSTSTTTSGSSTAGANDVLGTIMGDLLAGLSVGFPGSSAYGDMTSGEWWNLSLQNDAFGNAQSNSDFYNTWAAELANLTSSYGIAYEDRFGQNLLAFSNVDISGFSTVPNGFLEITLQADANGLGEAFPVPEPATLPLGLTALLLFVVRGRRARFAHKQVESGGKLLLPQ